MVILEKRVYQIKSSMISQNIKKKTKAKETSLIKEHKKPTLTTACSIVWQTRTNSIASHKMIIYSIASHKVIIYYYHKNLIFRQEILYTLFLLNNCHFAPITDNKSSFTGDIRGLGLDPFLGYWVLRFVATPLSCQLLTHRVKLLLILVSHKSIKLYKGEKQWNIP